MHRILTALLAASAPVMEVADGSARTVLCTNPASGATWPIAIDDADHTVDTYPARIDGDTIAWHDPRDGGHYHLDRASGALTVIIASSTGGYILHDRCRLEK